jgi:hypothetical protein
MSRGGTNAAVAALVLSLCASQGTSAAAGEDATGPEGCEPGEALAEPLPALHSVRDPVFATLLALFVEDRTGCVSGPLLASEIRRSGRKSSLPHERLRSIVRRREAASGETRVTILLDRRLDIPIPYRILWIYRPGSIWVDTPLEMTERRLGVVQVTAWPGESVRLESAGVFRLTRGQAGADIDGWVDRLFGAKLDDMTVHGLGVFQTDGRWYGLAIGANPQGASRMGLFDFASDAIVFPCPARLWAVARQLRSALGEMQP